MEEVALNINYHQELDQCLQFLQKCSDTVQSGGAPKYMEKIRKVFAGEDATVEIDLEDLANMEGLDKSLIANLQRNAFRYIELFSRAIDGIMPVPSPREMVVSDDPISVIIGHRLMSQQNRTESVQFPPSLLRKYTVGFRPISKSPVLAVRNVKSLHIGRLVRMGGLVTRTSEVKPVMSVCTFTCDRCGFEIYQEVSSSVFTPLVDCPSEECRNNNIKGELFMQTRGSKFLKFQEFRLQELGDQVPVGHIPRTMAIHAYGGLTKKIRPGDLVVVSGIFLPRPYTGFRALKAGLLADTFLHATAIDNVKPKYSQLARDGVNLDQIRAMSQQEDIYERLARSIAPEIYGLEDVKRSILLLMVGGVTRTTSDGMKVRGDINMCLMGDPGVAKSQLLKYVSKVAPRGIYTTGKGSSGVGLTAAVIKDAVTNEMVLEGGALVLADNGICCIDEFDKMDEHDRTSIHEVMEQQTISISKAGITTTLNARTSILAAANPLHGRYNIKKSPKDNINLPYALLSRFDILFLILDFPDMDHDLRLADHVLRVHQEGGDWKAEDHAIISPHLFCEYIAHAKQYQPCISRQLVDYIVGIYVDIRNNHTLGKDFYTTPRTLMAIIRMSQALARLRFRNHLEQSDVDEALRLLNASRSSLLTCAPPKLSRADPLTKIYTIIRAMGTGMQEINLEQVASKVKEAGYESSQLEECLELFDQASIWSVSSDRTRLMFLE